MTSEYDMNPGPCGSRTVSKPRRSPSLAAFVRLAWRRFREERCAQIASSLTFTSLLAIVPIITVALTLISAFPVFRDLLQNVEALVGLGYGKDPRLEHALTMIREKQSAQCRWPLEYNYTGKTWLNFGAKRQPNKWVTLRALRVLKAVA